MMLRERRIPPLETRGNWVTEYTLILDVIGILYQISLDNKPYQKKLEVVSDDIRNISQILFLKDTEVCDTQNSYHDVMEQIINLILGGQVLDVQKPQLQYMGYSLDVSMCKISEIETGTLGTTSRNRKDCGGSAKVNCPE